MGKSGKGNYNNKKKGKGYATEIIVRDERGKVVMRFAPVDGNTAIALRAGCDFVEYKLGIPLFNKGMVLMDRDFNPTNIPQRTTLDKKQFETTIATALSQMKGMA